MFFDESCFFVTSDSGHQLLPRERETCFTQHYICERDWYDSDVMVWVGIMHNVRTPLQIFEWGNATSERYCGEIILDHFRLFRDKARPDILFMDDNARPRSGFKHSRKWKYQLYALTCVFSGPKSYCACLKCSWKTSLTKNSPSLNRLRTEKCLERELG